MRKSLPGPCGSSLLAIWVLGAGLAGAQPPPEVRSDADLEAFLAEKAALTLDLPPLGYAWDDGGATGDAEQGSLRVEHDKVIYYFIHWGPIEAPTLTEAYVRERIPKVWPSEGLEVEKVEPVEIAGHQGFYAEVMPTRDFYRAFFMIWNCRETGRQFIADMNYNVRVRTPRSELEAELDTTRQSLACQRGAPTAHLASHPVRYDDPRYQLRFDHPRHWYVIDNPYGVPHPAYQGLRSEKVGSILAWLQDREVRAVPPPPERAALRRRWANLIRRVYEVDPLVCPRCGAEMRVIGFITETKVIKRILDHIRKRDRVSRSPPTTPVRRGPHRLRSQLRS